MNNNQYGFTPQKSTIDADMTVKNVKLDVKGAFDAAWWPAILNGLSLRLPQ